MGPGAGGFRHELVPAGAVRSMGIGRVAAAGGGMWDVTIAWIALAWWHVVIVVMVVVCASAAMAVMAVAAV